jgi:hypothetical protein
MRPRIVPVRDPQTGASRTRVWVDGTLRLEWAITWDGIAGAQPPFDAAPWKGGFMHWADGTLPPDDAEIAITLRRGCDIAMGRNMDLDSIPVATGLPLAMSGICHTMQPGVVEVAIRNVGSIRDFAQHPERLASGG